VIKGGPAEKGGLKLNDVVITFDGQDLEGEALANIIQHSEVGKEVEVVVLRDKKEVTLKVTVGDRADFN
jgi:serine protease Do